MELRDDQPMQHELRGRTYIVADVDPLDVDGVRTVTVGTIVFFVAFVALLPFVGRLQDDGHTWVLWTCLTGGGLGLLGLEYCRRRRAFRTMTAADLTGPTGPTGPTDATGTAGETGPTA